MKTCTVVCGYKPEFEKIEGDLIGVDKGCLYLLNKGYKDFISIGDFDSVNISEFELIKSNSKELIKLIPEKDDTDLEHTLHYLEKKGYKKVIIYGALGGRQDHNLLNIKFCLTSKLNIVFIGNKHKIFALSKGSYNIDKGEYKFLSLFAFEDSIVNLEGVKYPITFKKIGFNDLYTTSNEILEKSCHIDILEGRVLIVQCN
ncbi:MAG: thiamine diphosphokinase, partial [Erysipelotrichaceae bacterium]